MFTSYRSRTSTEGGGTSAVIGDVALAELQNEAQPRAALPRSSADPLAASPELRGIVSWLTKAQTQTRTQFAHECKDPFMAVAAPNATKS